MSVRAVVLRRVGELALEMVPQRALAPGEVRLAPIAAGVCASDVHGYAGRNERRAAGVIMGHEAAGVVVEVSSDVRGLAEGTLVALNPVISCGSCAHCRSGAANVCEARRLYGCVPDLPGAFADSFPVRAGNVVAVAAETPPEWAALCEPLAVGAHAAALAGAAPGSRVAVVGGGIIGLGAALAAHRRGAGEVTVVEPDERRRSIAQRLGLDAIAPPNPPGADPAYDVVIEAVGRPQSMALALALTPVRGEVVVVGLADAALELPASVFVMGERRVRGSAVYTDEEFRATVGAVERGEVDLSPIVEERVTLEELPRVFAEYAAGTRTAMRTIVRP